MDAGETRNRKISGRMKEARHACYGLFGRGDDSNRGRSIGKSSDLPLWLAPTTCGLVRAETPEAGPSGAIGLGNRGWSGAETNRATSGNELEFSARTGVASDYIYRGTTLSGGGPAAGAAL